MKTAFLFMSYEIKGKGIKGNWTAVVKDFYPDNIGFTIEEWIRDRFELTSEQNKVDFKDLFLTDIKCIY